MRKSFKILISIFLIFILVTCKGSDDADHPDEDDDDHTEEDHLDEDNHDHSHDSHDDDHSDEDDHDHDDVCHHDHHHSANADPTATEVGHAFLVTMFAGLSTVIGAAAAFCVGAESINTEHSTFLAGCLSFAAAVMLYVSFIEIWHHAL